MIKVAKFGGSSVASPEQFQKVKNIIDSDKERRIVVTSACGKETHDDYKITDLLYLCEAHIRYGVSYESLFEMVENKYYRIRDELGLHVDLEKEFKIIRDAMKPGIDKDYLVSRGEYLTGLLLAEYLGYKFVDAKDVIYFEYDGSIDLERSKEEFSKISFDTGIVLPGFYGSLPNGEIRLMSRGGSDITGAIISNIIDADMYENWTDVSGIYVADPRIISDPISIPYITYSELRAMSYLGANVLHDNAIFPVKLKNIPINIRNTNAPNDPGTIIQNSCEEIDKKIPVHAVTGITGRKDFTIITFSKNHASTEIGFLRKVLSVFEEFHISIEFVPSTVDTFSIIVNSKSVHNCLYEIVAELEKRLDVDDVKVEDHLALVAIVGRAMKQQPGMSGRFLSEFGDHKINIKVISQTADELCILVGVSNDDFEKSIHVLYDKFIHEENK